MPEFETTAQGSRVATSVGGVLTGRGADIIIIDDPLKPGAALSQTQREAANEWYDHTLYSRLNDKLTGAIVLIMHRLHESLPSGVTRGTISPAMCWRKSRGRWCGCRQLRMTTSCTGSRRCSGGEYNFAGQYQQAPSPLGGGMVKAAWFRNYAPNERPEEFDRVVQSWDTATKQASSAPTLTLPRMRGREERGCTTWGIKGKDLYLLHVLRRRMEYPELKRAVREQCEAFAASVVLIEDKASGTQLIQELIEQGLHAVTRYQPQSDKVMRMHAQTAMIENGFVHLPKEAGWLAEYLHELTVFPKGKHDDLVDSTAQMLDWFKRGRGPSSNARIYQLYKERYEAQQAGLQTTRPEPLSVMAKRLGILRPLRRRLQPGGAVSVRIERFGNWQLRCSGGTPGGLASMLLAGPIRTIKLHGMLFTQFAGELARKLRRRESPAVSGATPQTDLTSIFFCGF